MRRLLYFTASVFLCGLAVGQTTPEPAAGGELEAAVHALGLALNTGGVYYLVFLILKWKRKLRIESPQFIPIIAISAGPLLNYAAVLIANSVGIAIDFSPAIAALSGPAAVTLDQIYRQRQKAHPRAKLLF